MPIFSKKRLYFDFRMNRLAFLCIVGVWLTSCTKTKYEDFTHGFPEEVATIFRNSCSQSGCHNSKSFEAAAGLNLETWEALFEGSRGGSAVIPYSPLQSFLLYSINTDSSKGPILAPNMPIGNAPLSAEEFETIRNWIAEGARNSNGEERFHPLPTRRKWYVSNQGCDMVAVFDAESRQIMRYVEVGSNPDLAEQPIVLKMSKDQRFWYLAFLRFNPRIEKYSSQTDRLISTIPIGFADWRSMEISNDGRLAFLASPALRRLAVVDLVNEQLVSAPELLNHEMNGLISHPIDDKLYLARSGRSEIEIREFDQNGQFSNIRVIDLKQNIPPSEPNLLPFQIKFKPDGTQYFVTCLGSNELRVFNADSDSLMQVISMPALPTKMEISKSTNQIFISCMDDVTSFPNDPERRGSIVVLDLISLQQRATIYAGYQSFAMIVDDDSGLLAVANRNLLATGPAQHHSSPCQGRNGNLTLIDLENLELVKDYKIELLVDPIEIALKK